MYEREKPQLFQSIQGSQLLFVDLIAFQIQFINSEILIERREKQNFGEQRKQWI